MLQKEMRRGFPLIWSAGAVSVAGHTVMMRWLSRYTSGLGIAGELVDGLSLASLPVGCLVILASGILLDRTKARPWELLLIPLWLLTLGLFSLTGGEAGVSVLVLLIGGVLLPLLAVAGLVYLARAAGEEELRGKALLAAGIAGGLGYLGIAWAFSRVWQIFSLDFGKAVLVFGVPLLLVGLVRFWLIEERAPEGGPAALREVPSLLLKNRPLLLLTGAVFLMALASGEAAEQDIFISHLYGGYDGLSLVLIVMPRYLVCPLAALLVLPALRKKREGGFLRLGAGLAVAGLLIRYLSGTNGAGILLGSMLASLPGPAGLLLVMPLLFLRCMDREERLSGRRLEGPVCALFLAALRLGSGLTGRLSGLMLDALGYAEGAAPSQEILSAVRASFSLVPALLMAGALALLVLFEKQGGDGT